MQLLQQLAKIIHRKSHETSKGQMQDKEVFKWDVFLSHSSDDKNIVRDIANRLKDDGVRVWFDEWEIQPGDSIPTKDRRRPGVFTRFVIVHVRSSLSI